MLFFFVVEMFTCGTWFAIATMRSHSFMKDWMELIDSHRDRNDQVAQQVAIRSTRYRGEAHMQPIGTLEEFAVHHVEEIESAFTATGADSSIRVCSLNAVEFPNGRTHTHLSISPLTLRHRRFLLVSPSYRVLICIRAMEAHQWCSLELATLPRRKNQSHQEAC